jgi:hypothetical protein
MLLVIVRLIKGDLVPTALADDDLRADEVLEEDAERLVVFENTSLPEAKVVLVPLFDPTVLLEIGADPVEVLDADTDLEVDELPEVVLVLVTEPVVLTETFPVFVKRLVLEGVTELEDVLEAGADLEIVADPVELLDAELEREPVPDVEEVLDVVTEPVVVGDEALVRETAADPVVVLLDVVVEDKRELSDDVFDCDTDFVDSLVLTGDAVRKDEGLIGQVARAVLVPVVVRVEVFDMVVLNVGTIPVSSKYLPGKSYSTMGGGSPHDAAESRKNSSNCNLRIMSLSIL